MTRLLLSLVSRFTAVLQGMPSPLEIGACIAVVDVIEGNNYFQMSLAVTSLFLAVCDWHVPRVISYNNFICRFLLAICMQALRLVDDITHRLDTRHPIPPLLILALTCVSGL